MPYRIRVIEDNGKKEYFRTLENASPVIRVKHFFRFVKFTPCVFSSNSGVLLHN